MPNRLGQHLTQEQSLSLSPVQLLTSKLVELTGLELTERIERELEENPALDEGSNTDEQIDSDFESNESSLDQDWELGEYASEDDIPSYKLRELQERQSFREEIPFASNAPSLDTLLLDQLMLEGLTDREVQLARYIVGNISTEGYLARSAGDLQDDLLFKEGLDYSLSEVEAMIEQIKTLEPAGIGAYNLQECLLLQVERREPQTLTEEHCSTLLREYFDDFMAKRFDRIVERSGISREELAECYTLIGKLDPKPGVGFNGELEDQLVQYNPDFIVWEDENGELNLTLSREREIRPLRLNPTYQEMLEQSKRESNARKKRDTQDFIKHKLDQAKWFIEALGQRQDTLRRTMSAIVAWQADFFRSGDIADLRPMLLKDISAAVGLDISTISRVSNSKSVQTPHGVYMLKFFFGDGYVDEEGNAISTKAIKQQLQELIDNEDKQNPFTDEELVDKLRERGYNLARRTIAKYRESLKLPIARLRREV